MFYARDRASRQGFDLDGALNALKVAKRVCTPTITRLGMLK
jgi:hypothetical protein